MRQLRDLAGSIALAAALAAGGAPSAAAQTGAPQTDASAIDPAAMAAMDRMSAALQALPRVAFDAEFTREQVLETGQKLQ